MARPERSLWVTLQVVILSTLCLATAGCRIPWPNSVPGDNQFLLEPDEPTDERSPVTRQTLAQRLRSKSRPSSEASQPVVVSRKLNESANREPSTEELTGPRKESTRETTSALDDSAPVAKYDSARTMAPRTSPDDEQDPGLGDLSTSSPRKSQKQTRDRATVSVRFSDADDTGDTEPSSASSDNSSASLDTRTSIDTRTQQSSRRTVNEERPPRQSNQVKPAAFVESDLPDPMPSDVMLAEFELQELAEAMLDKMEQESSPDSAEQRIDLATKQRLVRLAIGDLAGAQVPIDGLPPEEQAYFQKTLQGLHEATDATANPAVSRRMTRALESHRQAAASLANVANLEILNLAFCTEVDSFGVVTKFPHYEFRQDQEVLLYCELENFVSKSVRGGYETRLQGNYEIVDADGRRIAAQVLPEDSDICAQRRRDFYIAYRLHMPEKIEPGQYQMRLTIEDLQARKLGQAKIDFQVVR